MQITQFFSVLVILVVMAFTCDSYTPRICRNRACEDQCHRCRWGTVWNDICNFDECALGPGDSCNEDSSKCADSLQCRCGTCHGCSSSTRAEHKCHNPPINCFPSESEGWPQILGV